MSDVCTLIDIYHAPILPNSLSSSSCVFCIIPLPTRPFETLFWPTGTPPKACLCHQGRLRNPRTWGHTKAFDEHKSSNATMECTALGFALSKPFLVARAKWRWHFHFAPTARNGSNGKWEGLHAVNWDAVQNWMMCPPIDMSLSEASPDACFAIAIALSHCYWRSYSSYGIQT